MRVTRSLRWISLLESSWRLQKKECQKHIAININANGVYWTELSLAGDTELMNLMNRLAYLTLVGVVVEVVSESSKSKIPLSNFASLGQDPLPPIHQNYSPSHQCNNNNINLLLMARDQWLERGMRQPCLATL